MACPKPDSRVTSKAVRSHFKGLRGPDLARLYIEVRYLLFGRNPSKVSRELADYDQQNPDAHLRLKV